MVQSRWDSADSFFILNLSVSDTRSTPGVFANSLPGFCPAV